MDTILKFFQQMIPLHNPPSFLLPFIGIGMGLIIFSLKEYSEMIKEYSDIMKAIQNRELKESDISYYQDKTRYYRFIMLMYKMGAFYFLSFVLLLFLCSYPDPITKPIPISYTILYSIAYLMVIVPTLVIFGSFFINLFFTRYRDGTLSFYN